MSYNICKYSDVEKLYQNTKKYKFYWFVFQKRDTNLKTICDRINNNNTTYFQLIDTEPLTCADPFIFKYGDKTYIFYEKVNRRIINDYPTEIGDIYHTEVKFENDQFKYSKPVCTITANFHLSYPFVFEDNGQIYLMPEQMKSGKLTLYICDSFPDRWREHVIFKGKFSDSTIFKHNGYYWLFTTEKKKDVKEFKIFYTKTLLGTWSRYTNKIKTNNTFKYDRCGGSVIRENNEMFFPFQIIGVKYGSTLHIEKIIKITPDEIVFEHAYELNRNNHHYSCTDEFYVTDFNNHNDNPFFNYWISSSTNIDKLNDKIKGKNAFWLTFQKRDEKFENLCNKINNANTKYFQTIDPETTNYANSFLFDHDNKTYLIYIRHRSVEEQINDIYCCELKYQDGYFKYSLPRCILTDKFDFSNPCIFKDSSNNDQIYLLPEQFQREKLVLYVCRSFPDQWNEYVLFNGKFIDPIIFKHNEYYWIFATEKRKGVKEFTIFYSKTILDNWQKYTGKIETDNPSEYTRCRGTVFTEDNKLYLPLHPKSDGKDRIVHIEEIIELTPKKVQFKHCFVLDRNVHHFSCGKDFYSVDFNNIYGNSFFDEFLEPVNNHWNDSVDKQYLKQIYYEIGDHLRTKSSKNVLDIGTMLYDNIYNYNLLNNHEIDYYQIDSHFENDYIKKSNCTLLEGSVLNLAGEQFNNFFDIIITHNIPEYMTNEDVQLYFENIHAILKDDGRYYLEVNESYSKNKDFGVDLNYLHELFNEYKSAISYYDDRQKNRYTFYFLAKKS